MQALGAAAAVASGASMVTLSATEQRELMAAMVAARTATEAAYLHVLSQFDRSPGVVPGVSRRTGFAFLTQKLNHAAGVAASDVAAARQLDPAGAGYDAALLAETDPAATAEAGDADGAGDPDRAATADPDGVSAAAGDITGAAGSQGSAFGAGATAGAGAAAGSGAGAGAGPPVWVVGWRGCRGWGRRWRPGW